MTGGQILRAYRLKHTDRRGWLRAGVDPVESVAAHSWGMAYLAVAACPPHLDQTKVLALCVVHDVAEAIVGDITPHDGISKDEKRRLEADAADLMLSDEMRNLFSEYCEQLSDEARFVRQLDKLDMALQALVYRSAGVDTSEFVESALPHITNIDLRRLLHEASSAAPE